MTPHLERLRKAELGLIREHFRPGMRVLEIGGGNGYQASIIASWGCEVLSVDIPPALAKIPRHHPLVIYDGIHIPAADHSFDLVYSSSVLEHIADLKGICGEMRRVLKPDGLAIHLMPSASWRLWTILTHYLYLAKASLALIRGTGKTRAAQHPTQLGVWCMMRRALIPGPHGEFSSAWSELHHYQRTVWAHVLATHGFLIEHQYGNRIFYTGNEILPCLPVKIRSMLAVWLGSACHVFTLRVPPPTPETERPVAHTPR